MPELTVEIDAAPVDLLHWSAVVPLFVSRFRGIGFDDDGVARFPSGRREGLRLLAGVPGRVGATYRIVFWETVIDPVSTQPMTRIADPVTIMILADDVRELRFTVSDGSYTAEVAVESPGTPTAARLGFSMDHPDLPSWVGKRIDLHGRLDVSDRLRPALTVNGEARGATATGALEHRGRTLRTTIAVHPRGLLAFASLVWPFVRRRLRRELITQLTGWWPTVVATLADDVPLEGAVDEAMLDLERSLVEDLTEASGRR